jgi:hypothetical protein
MRTRSTTTDEAGPARRLARWVASLLLGGTIAATATTAAAQETAPYPNGTSGIKAGTVPPPGHYWLIYNRLYESRQNKDQNGDTVLVDGEGESYYLNAYANVHRFIHITDYKIFGADYGWNAVIPLVGIDLEIGAYDVADSAFRIADINVEPFVIEWHKPRYDFGFVYGFFAPTAERNDARPALPGKGFWTNYFGAAGTYYFDDEREWSISMLSRYEFCGTRYDKDINAGNNFSFEWGASRNIAKVLEVGVSGYCSWQTTLDSGSAVDYVDYYDRVLGIGPEVQYYSKELNLGYHFRYWWEFDARNRSEGTIATITIVKPF